MMQDPSPHRWPASKVLMVEPLSFKTNVETLGTNEFQKSSPQIDSTKALREFHGLVNLLAQHSIEVELFKEPPHADTPDALFPNNWFAQMPSGKFVVFPMLATNRRREVHTEWLTKISPQAQLYDLRGYLQDNLFLEGTGSLILDHEYRMAYACVSPRTSPEVFRDFCKISGYKGVLFQALSESGTPYYHTNVIMALGLQTVILCMEALPNLSERQKLENTFIETKKTLIQITRDQVANFAGNLLRLNNAKGEPFWVGSTRAFQSFTQEQLVLLKKEAEFIHVPLTTIEDLGGGSARCMMAEIFKSMNLVKT
jgi:hypothetical protein